MKFCKLLSLPLVFFATSVVAEDAIFSPSGEDEAIATLHHRTGSTCQLDIAVPVSRVTAGDRDLLASNPYSRTVVDPIKLALVSNIVIFSDDADLEDTLGRYVAKNNVYPTIRVGDGISSDLYELLDDTTSDVRMSILLSGEINMRIQDARQEDINEGSVRELTASYNLSRDDVVIAFSDQEAMSSLLKFALLPTTVSSSSNFEMTYNGFGSTTADELRDWLYSNIEEVCGGLHG